MIGRRGERGSPRPRDVVPRLALALLGKDDMRALLAVLLLTTIHTTVAEFVEIQGLSSPELRERFALPESCEPSVAALRARHDKVTVLITCAGPDDDDRRHVS